MNGWTDWLIFFTVIQTGSTLKFFQVKDSRLKRFWLMTSVIAGVGGIITAVGLVVFT